MPDLSPGLAGVGERAYVPREAVPGRCGRASATQFGVEGSLQAFGQIAKCLRGLTQVGVFLFELADPSQALLDRSGSVIRFDHFASSDANDLDGMATPKPRWLSGGVAPNADTTAILREMFPVRRSRTMNQRAIHTTSIESCP